MHSSVRLGDSTPLAASSEGSADFLLLLRPWETSLAQERAKKVQCHIWLVTSDWAGGLPRRLTMCCQGLWITFEMCISGPITSRGKSVAGDMEADVGLLQAS